MTESFSYLEVSDRKMFYDLLSNLTELDASLPHETDAVWDKDVFERRNRLVWFCARYALVLGMQTYVSIEKELPVVYIELPKQVSWHVPNQNQPPGLQIPVRVDTKWDGHTREQKAARIKDYLEGHA